jgi:tryptophan synthase alpha chain
VNPIDAVFRQLRQERRKAFMPFVTAGDPDVAGTVRLVEELARRGASLIELGFPYSDPIADGPVLQASYTRALERGLSLDGVFRCARQADPFRSWRWLPIAWCIVEGRNPSRAVVWRLD